MPAYQLTSREKDIYEKLQQPFAVYQFVAKRVVTLAVSDGFCRLLGYDDRAQAMYDMDHNMYRDTHPDDVTRIANAAVRFATEGGEYNVIYRSRTRDGGYRIIHARGTHVTTETGERLAHVWYMDEGTYTDTPDKADSSVIRGLNDALHAESILKSGRYDALTGLPNLSWFLELAEAGKETLRKQHNSVALLYIDLNGMKYYNHRNGFTEGDKLLRSFAQLLVRIFSSENCCHIGADRFAAYTKASGIEEVLAGFFREAEQINGGHSLPVSVGIHTADIDAIPVTLAYDRAKIACDSLRKSNASAFSFYSPQMGDDIARRQYIQNNIDRAVSEKWIQVYYQPIVRAVNEKVCDEEALARWNDPAEGFLSPAEFVPHLESAGLIWKLDLYVLEQVLEKMRKQRDAGLYIVPHSVNLSRSDFDACDIAEEFRRRVDAAGIERSMITVEITESVVGSDPDFIKTQVERFRSLGFPVWMDDFGSGYSSLDVLQSIRFDLIKFDMGFLRKLDESVNGRIILTELMKMAQALGVNTVCEGVETEAQVRFLQEIGCTKLQGFYFCRPIPFEQVLERYEKGIQIGFEDPDTSAYYEAIGRVNLYDPGMIAGDETSVQNSFKTLPMGIIEVRGDSARFVRSNPSYRDFLRRSFGMDVSALSREGFMKYSAAFMHNVVKACCKQGARAFYDEKLPDGSTVHSFARLISRDPVSGSSAIAVAVLSISAPEPS